MTGRGRTRPPPGVATAVDDEVRATERLLVEVAGHLVAMLACHQRAHLGRRVAPRSDLDRRDSLRDRIDQLLADVADRDNGRDGHAALTGGAVSGGHRRISRSLDVRIRQHDHVVLGAAECLDPLTVAGPGLVDVARDRCRSTNDSAAISGCSSRRSTASRAPCTTVKTPSGSPACFQRSAKKSDGDGSFSLGLRMKVLPHAIALANIHIGTIAGKLKV